MAPAKQAKAEPKQVLHVVRRGPQDAPPELKGHTIATPPVPWEQHRRLQTPWHTRAAGTGPRPCKDVQGARCSLLRKIRRAATAAYVHQTKYTAFCADIVASPLQSRLRRHCGDELYTRSLTLLRGLGPIFWKRYAASWTKQGAGHRSNTTPPQRRFPLKLPGRKSAPDGGATAASPGSAEAFYLTSAGASSRPEATQATQNSAKSNLVASSRLLARGNRTRCIPSRLRDAKSESTRPLPHGRRAPRDTGRHLFAIIARQSTGGPKAENPPAKADYNRPQPDAPNAGTQSEKFDSKPAWPQQGRPWSSRLSAYGLRERAMGSAYKQRSSPPKKRSEQQRLWVRFMTQLPHAPCGAHVGNSGNTSWYT